MHNIRPTQVKLLIIVFIKKAYFQTNSNLRIYFLNHRDLKDKTRTELTQITGCNPPCFYRKFFQVGNKEVIKSFNKHGTN